MNLNSRRTDDRPSKSPLFVYGVLGFCILVAFGMPFVNSSFIYPAFINQLGVYTEEEAVRACNHLTRTINTYFKDGWIHTSDEMRVELKETISDFKLWKIKLFSPSGIVIYSSDIKDVGVVNKHSYFKDVVTKGGTFTKIVNKDTETMEGQFVTRDVVETYVPMMNEGRFMGAWELYYDITARRQALDNLLDEFNFLLYILSGFLLLVAAITTFGLKRSNRERREFEEALIEMANTDKLTGVLNRRSFLSIMEWEAEKLDRYQRHACFLMLDIDHFKNVNDTYGHQVGDEVLVAVAEACVGALRKSDRFARYGGEEFAAYLPETEKQGAIAVAQRLRLAVESLGITAHGKSINVTISVGLSVFDGTEAFSLEMAIHLADQAMYTAKSTGRNKVCCYDG